MEIRLRAIRAVHDPHGGTDLRQQIARLRDQVEIGIAAHCRKGDEPIEDLKRAWRRHVRMQLQVATQPLYPTSAPVCVGFSEAKRPHIRSQVEDQGLLPPTLASLRLLQPSAVPEEAEMLLNPLNPARLFDLMEAART